MKAMVVLECGACLSRVRTRVRAVQCPESGDHCHLRTDEPVLMSWWYAHYEPSVEIVGVEEG